MNGWFDTVNSFRGKGKGERESRGLTVRYHTLPVRAVPIILLTLSN